MKLFNNTKDSVVKPPQDSLFGNKTKEQVQEDVNKVIGDTPAARIIKNSMFGNKKSEQPVISGPIIRQDAYSPVNNITGLTDVLNLRGIRQVYKGEDNDTILFDNFNFDIEDIPGQGQFTSLLGKSGCGKCFSENTKITIRNKKTLKIEEVTIKEFLKHFPQPM